MPRYNVTKSRGKAKIKVSKKRQVVMNKILESYSEEQDTTIAVIQELIPLGLKAVGQELQREVQELAGKRYASDGLLIALGVTLDGVKMILGIEQIHSENSRAIEQRFGIYAFIQRCQWHKRENVISYLDDAQQELCR